MIEQHEEQHKVVESLSFKVELVKKCSKLLDRQVQEGGKLDRFKGNYRKMGKGEWGQNLPPNFTIEGQGETQRYNNKYLSQHLTWAN